VIRTLKLCKKKEKSSIKNYEKAIFYKTDILKYISRCSMKKEINDTYLIIVYII